MQVSFQREEEKSSRTLEVVPFNTVSCKVALAESALALSKYRANPNLQSHLNSHAQQLRKQFSQIMTRIAALEVMTVPVKVRILAS